MEYETLVIAPQSQRHAGQILWLAGSLLLQLSRMSPFRRSVSAAKNSVPDSSFGDWFDDCVGSSQFGPDQLHHPVSPKPPKPPPIKNRTFCRDCAGLFPDFFRSWVSADVTVLSRHRLAPVSATKKSHSISSAIGAPPERQSTLLRTALIRHRLLQTTSARMQTVSA